jgi:LuxR family maltose regulon positive regulatory protein
MPGRDDPFHLVETETERPPERPGLVRRDGILRRLASASHAASLVVLVAPPGYGKTTVLGQWSDTDTRTFAWVSVEDADNDPIRLVQHIVTSLNRVEPVDDEVLTSLASRGASPAGVVVPRLLAWLAGRPGGRVLVLDDLHRLHNSVSLGVIEVLVTQLPPGWHLAVATRTRPRLDLALAPLRRQRRYLELGAEDLAFSVQEAGTVLAEVGVDVPEEVVQALVRRTEGWPAGVYLTALALRDRRDEAAVPPITGGDAHLGDYFRDKVLDRQEAETVRFLLRTAVLERMSGALCDAVLATSGSAARLEEIENSNLFVVRQDRRGEWYRYHHLFAEMLLSELRRREPGQELVLHRRAAAWFSEHELPEEAINHALAGRDVATAATLTTTYATPFAVAGRIATVRRWIEAMGDEGPEAYPPLAVIATWMWALEGEAAKAHQSLLTAESASFSGRPADGSASLESGIRIIRGAMAPLGIDQMLHDARRAVELEPPGSRWHPFATWILGSAELLHGDPDRAAKAFERTAYLGREGQRPAATMALAQLALLAAERDDWPGATAHTADAQELIRAGRLQDYPSSMLCYAASAKVATHQGDRQSALLKSGNALRLSSGGPRPVVFPWLTAQVAIVLGRIFLELEDVPAARVQVSEARGHLAGLASQGALRDQLERLARDVARRGGPADGVSVMTLTQAELRVLHLLPTHLTLAEIGRELDVSRSTVKTHVAAVYRKLHTRTRTDAVRRGRQLGLLSS